MEVDWWPTPVWRRVGAPERLAGIRVYHDFRWRDVFRDGRTQFRHGKALAEFVIRECPPDLTPALMLTRDPQAQQGFRRIADHLLFVTNIDEYRRAEGNVALTYLARH